MGTLGNNRIASKKLEQLSGIFTVRMYVLVDNMPYITFNIPYFTALVVMMFGFIYQTLCHILNQ